MIQGSTISGISSNKHTGNINHNAGTVKLQCYINEYCPFDKTDYVEQILLYNDQTVQALPKSVREQLGWVVHENGIFLKPRYYYHSNYLLIDGEFIGNPQYLEPLIDADADVAQVAAKIDEYSWDVTQHAFQNPKFGILKRSQYGTSGSSTTADPQRWSARRLNEDLENKDNEGDKTENKDSNIIYPFQESVNESFFQGIIDNITGDSSKGIHWRVEKTKPLFRGEDFFLQFRRTSFSTDMINRKGDASFVWVDEQYKPLDVSYNNPEINGALVYYDVDGNASDRSRDLFDFTRQPYIILEFNKGLNTNWSYFMILAHKAKPRFIKVISGRSYFVSEYKGKTTSELFRKDILKVAVRNHLGKLIVSFNDDDNNPWVIENELVSEEYGIDFDGPVAPKLFCIPACKLSIWAGNMGIGFTFGPIVYEDSVFLDLPPLTKEEISGGDGGKIEGAEKFVVPKHAQVLLSVRDAGLSKNATPSKPGEFRGEGSVARVTRKPFYTCDAGSVTEYVTTGGSGKAVKKLNFESYFQDFGDYIKEISDVGQDDLVGTSWIDLTKSEEEEDDTNENFYLNVYLYAGSHKFESGYILANCKTPVLTLIKLTNKPLVADDKWEPTSPTDNINISDYVLSYSDNWTSQDFNSMEHNATIDFLITRGGANIPGYEEIESLQNKAFYIQVLAGYSTCNYSLLGDVGSGEENKEIYKLMTGICYGGVISEKAGERIMTCQVFDYSKILQDMMIFNSPFFDGVRDINAIYELSKMCGLGEYNFKPAELLRLAVDVEDEWGGDTAPDGRLIPKSSVYALPFNYGQYQGDPAFRFKDGDFVWAAMQQICQRSGKVLFFDADGLLHYEEFPIAGLIYGPDDNPGGGGGGDVDVLWSFTANPNTEGQLIFDKVERELAVGDVYNNIFVISTTPYRELVIADETNRPSMDDPGSEGFLGYMKTFFQMDGIFGSVKATRDYAKHLTKFFKPPVVYKFSTFGLPLRPFDIAEIDGQKIIILNVSHTIVAKDNKWWMNVEGEWFHGQEFTPDT